MASARWTDEGCYRSSASCTTGLSSFASLHGRRSNVYVVEWLAKIMCGGRNNVCVVGLMVEIFHQSVCLGDHLVKWAISGVPGGSMARRMVLCVATGGMVTLRSFEDRSEEGVRRRGVVVAFLLFFGVIEVKDSFRMRGHVSLGYGFG